MKVRGPTCSRLVGLACASALALGASAAPASAAPAVSDIVVTKKSDKGSPDLSSQRRTIEGESTDYLVITMDSASVMTYDVGGP